MVTIAATGLTVGALLLVRRRAPEGSYFADGDRASGVFGFLATGFAVMLGFVVFLTFTRYDESRAGSDTEALVLIQQFETAQLLPEADGAVLSGQLVCYGRSVVYQEWPLMEEGSGASAINPWGLQLFSTLDVIEPTTASEQSAYDAWLAQTSAREEARRDRLHGAEGVIPAAVWVVLFLSGTIVLLYMLFFADPGEGRLTQAMLIGSVTAVMVMSLFVLRVLDHPYEPGVGGLQPVAMERSLQILEDASGALGLTLPIPCDVAGVPVAG